LINPFPETVPDPKYVKELWFPICDFHIPGICPGYQISIWGRVYCPITGSIYPTPNCESDWYIVPYIHLKSEEIIPYEMHRLMMDIFKPTEGSENLEVNHIDGVKYHNWIWNLEWVTHKENMHHAFDTGLAKKIDARYPVITAGQANKIADLLSKGLTPKEIERMLCDEIPEGNISMIAYYIRNGLSWKDISAKYDFSNAYNKRGRLFTDEQLHAICQAFVQYGRGLSYK
jgi:hypothetical protein